MNPSDFQSDRSGRLRRVGGTGSLGYWTFVPNDLPPTITWTDDLVCRVGEAERKLGELAVIGRGLPNPSLLVGPFKRLEAVLSSRIEGTRAGLSEILDYEARGDDADGDLDDTREVENYIKALDHGVALLESLPVSKRLILEVHRMLMDGVRGDEATPGEFRRSQNWIGRAGSTINTATYVPPAIEEMEASLDALERFINTRGTVPPLVRLAMIHYQFEAIHPFLDGNGRLGRLLIPLVMISDGLLPSPLLYLSAYFERYRSDYYAHLVNVSQHGEWEEWIEYFLRGVAVQSTDAVRRADVLLRLRDSYRERFTAGRSPAPMIRLVDHLFAHPSVTVHAVAGVLNLTFTSALTYINRLVESGVLVETTGRKRSRVWVAAEVRAALEATPESLH